jgi:hypothetical protein
MRNDVIDIVNISFWRGNIKVCDKVIAQNSNIHMSVIEDLSNDTIIITNISIRVNFHKRDFFIFLLNYIEGCNVYITYDVFSTIYKRFPEILSIVEDQIDEEGKSHYYLLIRDKIKYLI